MRLQSTICLASLWLGLAAALSGYGSMDKYINYDPMCANACLRIFTAPMLACSDMTNMDMDMMALSMYTFPSCFATDDHYLMSMAYCLDTKCPAKNLDAVQSQFFASDHITNARLTWFWENRMTGDRKVIPKWTYAEALAHITETPTRVVSSMDTLNYTGLANDTVFIQQAGTLWSVYREGVLETNYGLVILVTGFALPILLTLVGFLPFRSSLGSRIKPYLVYPSVIGSYHVRALPFKLGNAPTTGQALYIALMMILCIVLTAVDYKLVRPHMWYGDSLYHEGLAYVMWRTGCLGFAILPLVFSFSGRNNVLLWLTDWSHSTFILLHRWMARIFGVYVIVHSVLGLVLYVKLGNFASNEKMAWWIWGVVATLTTSVMLVVSVLWFRQKSYELFLIVHILLAVFTLAGCWYHVFYRFGLIFRYQEWLYACFAVWAFDRVVRVLRILKTGVRRATITEISDHHLQIDVAGVRWGMTPGQHAYAYFPTLHPLRPWENHPFSVLPTPLLNAHDKDKSGNESVSENSSDSLDLEKSAVQTRSKSIAPRPGTTTAGVTFFVKKSSGMTKTLARNVNILTFLDGPYTNNATHAISKVDRLVIISGGIGISGILPWLNVHSNAKLYWSVKHSAESLVDAVRPALDNVAEKEVSVGQRLDAHQIVRQETEAGWAKVGVVVCGPGGLCDDVRAAVVQAGRRGHAVELEVDAYTW